MKKSELVQMIREEIQNIIETEKEYNPTQYAKKNRLLDTPLKKNKEQGGEEIAEALPIPGTRQHDKTGMKPGYNKMIFRKGQVGGFLSDPEMDQAERDAHRLNNARRTGNTNLAKTPGAPSTNFQNAASGIKVKNPVTGKEILATSAYSAGPQHPAYNAAKTALKKEIVNLRHKYGHESTI